MSETKATAWEGCEGLWVVPLMSLSPEKSVMEVFTERKDKSIYYLDASSQTAAMQESVT